MEDIDLLYRFIIMRKRQMYGQCLHDNFVHRSKAIPILDCQVSPGTPCILCHPKHIPFLPN